MTLRFTVLGYELARITLDIEHQQQPEIARVADRTVKGISRLWVRHMAS